MQNLAGNAGCDEVIARELARCGIEAISVELTHTEVPYRIIGKLGDFTFKRCWYYWAVKGKVPLVVAKDLYADPVGRTDIRADGHCGALPPDQVAAETDGERYVSSYHIDTEIGLRLFTETIKKHELV